jgi:hypothetical protein
MDKQIDFARRHYLFQKKKKIGGENDLLFI